MKKQERKRGEHKGGTLATSLWRTGGGDLYDKIFIWFYGCIFHSLSSLGVCTQIWILWEPPLDQPNDCLSAISEPSVFLSRQMLCFAKRGQVQLCLIARFHTRICELTQTDTHTHISNAHKSTVAAKLAAFQAQFNVASSEPNFSPVSIFLSNFENNIHKSHNSVASRIANQ